MTINDIKIDPHIKDFIETRSVRQSTANEYIKRLTIYCNFIEKTPTELIEEGRRGRR